MNRARRLLAQHFEGGLDPAGEAELLALLEADPALAAEAAALEQTHSLLRHRFAKQDDARFVDEVVRTLGYLEEKRRFADRVEAKMDRRPARRIAIAAAALIIAVTALMLGRPAAPAGDEAEPRIERLAGRGGALRVDALLELEAGAEADLVYPDGSRLSLRGPAALKRMSGEGKRLQLLRGGVEVALEAQPAGRAFRLSTGIVDLSSGGGRFSVDAGLLRVLEGRVRVEGSRLDVPGGYSALLSGSALPELRLTRELEISVDLKRRYQRIEGFGTSMLDWKPRLASLYRTPEFAELWAQDLGASILRVPVEPETLPDEIADASLIRGDRLLWAHPSVALVSDLARALKARRGSDFQLVATVWSPPGWMKTTGRTVGTGRLREDRQAHFARFLAAYCKGIEARSGVPVAAVSLRNEAEWGVRFASCSWSPEDFLAVSEEILRVFAREGLRTRLLGPELVGRSRLEPMDEALAFARGLGRQAAGCAIALQGPLGPGEDDAQAWDHLRRTLEPRGRGVWVTSAADHLPDWIGPGGALSLALELHDVLVHGGAEAYLYYQFADDEPAVALTRSTDTRSPKYAAFKQFSRFIRPGAVRVHASPDGAALPVAAFWHEADAVLTLVLVNRESESIRMGLRTGSAPLAVFVSDAERRCDPAGVLRPVDGRVELEIPAKSVVTLQTAR